MVLLEIPLYPSFKKLSLIHQSTISEFTNQFLPYSDFNFISMWSYDVESDIEITNLNNNLVVRFRDYITSEPFYSFLGTTKILETAQELLLRARIEGLVPKLQLIPNIVVDSEPNLDTHLVIVEERDDFDYILSATELKNLSGARFTTHRKLVHRFHRRVVNYRVELLNLADKSIQENILKVFDIWKQKKGKEEDEIRHELIAIKRFLNSSQDFQLYNIGVWDGEKLVGFLFSDLGHPNYVQVHFAKSDPSYQQLYYVMLHYLGFHMVEIGHELINIEQDLGIPGLRFAKEHWSPVHYLKKYTILPKVT